MLRCWIIRCMFMLPVLLCVVGWVWSGTHLAGIGYWRDYHATNLNIEKGGISIEQHEILAGSQKDGWSCGVRSIIRDGSEFSEEPTYWPRVGEDRTFTRFFFAREVGGCETFTTIVGFELDRSFGGPPWFSFFVPFWFPILVFASVLIFVWRKTRPEPNPKMAFPVEVGGHEG